MSGSFDAHWIPKQFLISGDPADVGPWNYFANGDLYTVVSSISARNLFTTAFVILNLLAGVVGVYLLQWRNTAKLLKKQQTRQTVPLYTLSPWMSASDTLLYTWYTHHLPGGHYGLFMLTTGIFGVVHQYFTSSYISSVPGLYGSCSFSTGVVFLPEFNERVRPISSWPAADTALYSQVYALGHGDPAGIYAKANSDTNFTVTIDSPDHLGKWTCSSNGNVTIPPQTPVDTINSTLLRNQSLYENARGFWHQIPNQPDTIEGLILWSSSDSDNTGKAWDIKASLAPATDVNQPIIVYNYDCQMTGPQIEWILPLIQSVDTLGGWSDRTYGALLQGNDVSGPFNSTTFGMGIEIFLNAIVMVAGSLNTATRPANGSYNSPDTYRCNVQRTIVCKEVFAMLAFLVLHLICFFILGAKYWIQIRFSDRSRRKALKEVPSNASSWQVAVLRDHFPERASSITAKNIPEYRYGWDAEGSDVLRFSKKGSVDERLEQISFLPKMDTNTTYANGVQTTAYTR